MAKKYIVSMQQLRAPIWITIKELFPNDEMANPIYRKIMDGIEIVLEDDCEEYQESD